VREGGRSEWKKWCGVPYNHTLLLSPFLRGVEVFSGVTTEMTTLNSFTFAARLYVRKRVPFPGVYWITIFFMRENIFQSRTSIYLDSDNVLQNLSNKARVGIIEKSMVNFTVNQLLDQKYVSDVHVRMPFI